MPLQPVTTPSSAPLPLDPTLTEPTPAPADPQEVPTDSEDSSDKKRPGKKSKKPKDPVKVAKTQKTLADLTAGTILASEYADLALGITAFGFERSQRKPFPNLPMPNFNVWRQGLTPTQDSHLRIVENVNGHLNNVFNAVDLIAPVRVDADGQIGYLIGGLDPALDSWRSSSITRGMMSYTGDDKRFKISHGIYAGAEYLIASEHLQRMRLQLPTTTDAPLDQLGMQDLIDAMNGDYVADDDNLPDVPGGFGLPITALHSAIGQDRVRIASAAGLLFQTLENENGRPSLLSLAGLGVIGADLALQSIGPDRLKPIEYVERLALAGGAFGIESLLTDDTIAPYVHNNYSYAVMGIAHPKILFYGIHPDDGTGFDQLYSEPTNSFFGLTSTMTQAMYYGGSMWAGVQSGRAIKEGTNAEKFLPLALGGVGLASQIVSNAVAGAPENWKHIGLGAAGFAVGTAIGYLLSKKRDPNNPATRNKPPVNFDLGISGTGAHVGISGSFDTTKRSKKKRSEDANR